MNVLIIYFSQTGNTEKIATLIGKGISETGNTCDLVEIKRARRLSFSAYDLIGLGTPTFYYREPRNVQAFIDALDFSGFKTKQCFLFCTHGSIIGNTFYRMAEQLSQKRAIVIGAFDCYGSSSLQCYPTPMHTDGHPDEIALEEAEQFGKSICSIAKRIQKGETDLVPKFRRVEDTWWAQRSDRLTPEFFRAVSPPLTINLDLCNLCLLCEGECPTDAIDLQTDPPQIQKDGCIYCWYCEKLCPTNAIEANWDDFAKGARGNLAKYVQELEKAEAEGKFRPYVDYKKIV